MFVQPDAISLSSKVWIPNKHKLIFGNYNLESYLSSAIYKILALLTYPV